MSKRGWNLRGGQPDGNKGRRLGGKAHAALNTQPLGDDSNRTCAQYWGQVGWMQKVEELGLEGARAYMSELGVLSFAKERREYSRYLGEMRAKTEEASDE